MDKHKGLGQLYIIPIHASFPSTIILLFTTTYFLLFTSHLLTTSQNCFSILKPLKSFGYSHFPQSARIQFSGTIFYLKAK